MKVDEVIDRMEHLIRQARRVPFSGQVVVDEAEILGMMDEIRHHLPSEIQQANWTLQEQGRLIAEAHAEAGRITARATERAESALRDHELLVRVERQAQQTLREAQARADEIVREAEAYALEQLQQLEAHLSRTLATVKRGVEALQATQPDCKGGRAPPSGTPPPSGSWGHLRCIPSGLCGASSAWGSRTHTLGRSPCLPGTLVSFLLWGSW